MQCRWSASKPEPLRSLGRKRRAGMHEERQTGLDPYLIQSIPRRVVPESRKHQKSRPGLIRLKPLEAAARIAPMEGLLCNNQCRAVYCADGAWPSNRFGTSAKRLDNHSAGSNSGAGCASSTARALRCEPQADQTFFEAQNCLESFKLLPMERRTQKLPI